MSLQKEKYKKLCETYGLSKEQYRVLEKLNTPSKVQDFLDTLPINHESEGETYMSVRRTLEAKTAHCLEGALIAALSFWIHGGKPLLLDLAAYNGDDHIVAPFKVNGRWGAVSKTNHATLRYRDPVYKTIRELAMSYFHEYIHLKTGEKILERFSGAVDLRHISKPKSSRVETIRDWISGEAELFWLAEELDNVTHEYIVPTKSKKVLRKADNMEMIAGNLIEWVPKS